MSQKLEGIHLMEAIINGDHKAFDHFYKQEFKKSFYFALQYLHEKTLSEDVVQESFLILWEKRKSLDKSFPIQPYFYSILKSRCLNSLRKLTNGKRVSDSLTRREYLASITALNDDSSDIFIEFQLEEFINKTYHEIPDKMRSSFILNRFFGLSYSDIAKKKGISVKIVEYHITQSLKLFKKRLKDFLPEEGVLVISFITSLFNQGPF